MPSLRPVAPADLEAICRHRLKMFAASGREEASLLPMIDGFRNWLTPNLANGVYFGFFAEEHGEVVGGVGLMVLDWPPNPNHPDDDRRGYVLNLYVEPEARGRGVAKRLMAAAEDEFRSRRIDYVILHATKMGRPLYEADGWIATSEMAKTLSRD